MSHYFQHEDSCMNHSSKLLSEVGFVAIKAGNFDSARTIFLSLQQTEPNNVAGNIGLASIALATGEMDEAIDLLEESSFSEKCNNYEAKKLLLIVTMLKGDQEKAGKIHHLLATEHPEKPNKKRLIEATEFFSPSKKLN